MRNDNEPIEKLGGRTWEELEIVEHEDGTLLFPDEIRKKRRTGWVAEPVKVRVLKPLDLILARAEAQRLAKKYSIEKDDLYFDEIEKICQLAIAIRTNDRPHAQLETAEELARDYDEACLEDISGRIAHYKTLLDPRDDVQTEEQLWGLVKECFEASSLGPLVDTPGHAQRSFLLFTVAQAFHSPQAPWAAPSSENSTQGPSTSTPSKRSSPAPG